MSLENHTEFIVLRENINEAQAQFERAGTVFIPNLVMELSGAHITTPPGVFRLESTQQTAGGRLGVNGRLQTGLEYKLEVSSRYTSFDNVFSVYDRSYLSAIRAELVQPLLRNAWSSIVNAPIRVASRRRDASLLLMQARAQRLLANVEIAYWRLVLAHEELQLRRSALLLSQQQVLASRKQVKLGARARTDVLEAQATVARDQESILISRRAMATAEGELARVIQPNREESLNRFEPVDKPQLPPTTLTLTEALEEAYAQRPDLAAARQNLQADNVAKEVAENALWPKVDLVGRVGLRGASGRLATGAGTSVFGVVDTHGLTGDLVPAIVPDGRVEGGFLRSLENLSAPEVMIGVQVEIPFDNGVARANLRIQEAVVNRRKARIELLRRQILYSVVTAFRELEADRQRVTATQQTIALYQRLLEGQQARFRNGVAISFDVLRANAAVTEARVFNLRAQIQSRISWARLTLARGSYLKDNQVDLEAEAQ